ncbi:MAG: hypothetical protein F6K55_08820 [Moorea sp. SIO4A3]|nr:hypothetical protein [Moorena sp. SIO4A3]
MTTNRELCHWAQQIKSTNPDIIYKGKIELHPVKDEQERETILSAIDEVVLPKKNKVGINIEYKGVKIYYNTKSFVLKSIPIERDNYGRLSPILSYGNFPEKKLSEDWIKTASKEIKNFALSIDRTFSSETLLTIKDALMQAEERKVNLQKKRNFQRLVGQVSVELVRLLIVVVTPLIIGWVLQIQITQLFQEVIIQPEPNVILFTSLQQMIHKMVIQIALFISVNNALLLILFKLPIGSLLKPKDKKNLR